MRKKAIEMADTWNKNLEVGAKIEGRYIKKEVLKTQYGISEKYIIETPEGKKIGIFSSASLMRQFANVPEDAYIWVEYKGEVVSRNGRPVKSFIVEYDDEK